MADARTRIAYILTPVTFGGAEKVNLNFLSTVDRARFDLTPLLLVRPWEKLPVFAEKLEELGYPFQTIPVAREPAGDYFRVPRVAARLYGLIKRGSFDLVHTHGYFADICGIPAGRLAGARTLATCHGYVPGGRKLKIYNALDMRAIRFAHGIVAVSSSVKEILTRSGIPASRVAVVKNAVTNMFSETRGAALRHERRAELDFNATDFVVGFAGRLSREKGVHNLLEAMQQLNEANGPVKLLIIGAGPEQPHLEQFCRDRGLEKAVRFVGFQAEPETWLPALDVMVLPSLTEGTPMILLESMTLQVPLIATAVGGVPDLVRHGVDGLLVRPDDPGQLKESILFCRHNPEAVNRMKKTALQKVEDEYALVPWCRTIEEFYSGLMQKQMHPVTTAGRCAGASGPDRGRS